MTWNPLKAGSPVCVCFSVGHDQCRDLVREGSVRTTSDLQAITGAGSRCALCQPYFSQIIAMYHSAAQPLAGGGEPPPSAGEAPPAQAEDNA